MSLWRRSWVVALLLIAIGCRRAEPDHELVVFAAVSLREAFTALGKDFERTHPGVELRFNFAGTGELRTQLEHGARADVFASADPLHMQALERAGKVSNPVIFARNEPVIVVSKDATGTIQSLADLPRAERIVIGTPEVPIGRYALQIFDRAAVTLGSDFRARVEAKVVSRELNVRQVLAKVRLGEAQAGVVYRSDVAGLSDVGVVGIPVEINVVAEYPQAIVTGTSRPSLARDFTELVASDVGRRALTHAGFSAGER